MIPITRKENYLNEIVGWGETAPEKPLTPEEFFFAAILGEAVQTPEPLSRYQIYLAKIAGRNISVPKPLTRLELFLAKACGMDIETPTPITREEIFWSNYSAIVDFEVEGVPPLTYKAIEGTLENYRIYGQTSRNLFDENQQMTTGVINSDGTIDTSITYAEYSDYIPIHTEMAYYFSCEYTTAKNARIAFYNSSKQFIDRMVGGSTNPTVTFNRGTLSDASFVRICLDIGWQKCMLNSGSTPLPYEPYSESVGDRTANLWDETIIQGGSNNTGTIIDGNPKRLRSDYIFVEPGETYSFASNLKIRLIYSYDDNNQKVSLIRDAPNGDISYTFTVPNAATKIIITVMKCINNVEYDITPDDFEWGQLEKGSVVTSYEPYGYRVPVTVTNGTDTQTTNLYLLEQIKMVGDEAEYIDYGEQKMHRIGADDIDVTLPALPTLPGTNVLSVGTAVQPSKVYVKYKGERQ